MPETMLPAPLPVPPDLSLPPETEWRERGRIVTENEKVKQAEAEAARRTADHLGRFPDSRRLAEANSAGFLRTSPEDAYWALEKFESFGLDPAVRNVRMLGRRLERRWDRRKKLG
ncbi:hypothetical protein H2199_006489 [Coniosporium tulheliwenetii]|uniref:Uncharacterized protein n=1 Tax=Coniosporium tulheliwenetii TaxID=3383036 RepID=A0ACC2YW22_9PEZI|nr:hypothetical protein H2199_006489 [Cladosporium sp. JES 115]